MISRAMCAVAGLAVVVLLSACTPGSATGGTTQDLPSKADTQLHPVGDPGLWFNNDYALGVKDVYATANVVCGITDGMIIESQEWPGYTSRVIARSLQYSQIVWEINDSRCVEGSTLDGTVATFSAQMSYGPGNLNLVAADTGEVLQTVQLDEGTYYGAKQISQVDGVRVAQIDSELLIGFDANGIVWQTSGLPGVDLTALGDGNIGVSHGLNGWISSIDGKTGETKLPRTKVDVFDVEWASDGYVLGVNESDPEYAFFDLQGKEIDRTVGEFHPGFYPRPYKGITFPLTEHINASTIRAVDATGVPAVVSNDNGYGLFLRGGEIEESQIGELYWPQGVSADGTLVLAYSEGDGFAIYDANGEATITWPLVDGLWVEGGYIVYNTPDSTQVLIPGR